MSAIPKQFTGPGLLDLQINGYAGFDFNGPASSWTAAQLHEIREALARRGVCGALITLMTDAPESMLARAKRFAELIEADAQLAAMFPTLHIEGPFLSPDDGPRGAHPLQHCICPADAPDLVERMRDASGGRVAIVTVAPELPGAIELIERISAKGICVAIGHTQANDETLSAAVEAGAKLSTHLGNGSHQMLPRLDNYIQAQLADDRLAASFIADGHHMPPTTLKNFIRAKTPSRAVLITDAIAAAEMPPGRYHLVGREVDVAADGRCAVAGEANLAGSTLTLDRAVLNVARHCDVSFAEAWAMASTRPAELIGMAPAQEVTVEVNEDSFALC